MTLFWRLFLQNLMLNRTRIHLVYRRRKGSKNRDFSRNGKIFTEMLDTGRSNYAFSKVFIYCRRRGGGVERTVPRLSEVLNIIKYLYKRYLEKNELKPHARIKKLF